MFWKYVTVALALGLGGCFLRAEQVTARIACAPAGEAHACRVSLGDRELFAGPAERLIPEVWTSSGFNGEAGAVYLRLGVVQGGRERHVEVPVRCADMAAVVEATRPLSELPPRPVEVELRCAPQTR